MSLLELNQIVARATQALQESEKFPVAVLAVKARRVAQAYPTDATSLGMSSFLNKRAESGQQVFMARSEFKDVYQRFYTRNNKFAESFCEELGLSSQAATISPTFQRDPAEGSNLIAGAYEKMVDPILSQALASAFDATIPYKSYSNQIAKKAQRSCLHELNRLGVPPKKIDVVAGQPDVLICQAAYQTPVGVSYVLIPIEVKQEQALIPTVFLGTQGFLDLERAALEKHLTSTAGKSYNIDVQQVLTVVANAKNGVPEPLSEVEEIMMRVTASKETPATHTINGILYQQVDQPLPQISLPSYQQPIEVQELSKQLTSRAGVAEFVLGKTNVELGRQLIRQALNEFGYRNAQIGVADNNDTTIFYAVSVDNLMGFKIPVQVVNKKVVPPSVALAQNRMVEFSKQGISELLANGNSDHNAAVVASPMFGFSPSDLVRQIRTAVQDNNLLQAEEALLVLQSSGDSKAYRVGYELYSAALKDGGLQKTATTETHCNSQYKTVHSKYMICAHTNLPLHKVYQDKNGDCHPMYRKTMSDSSEGGSFLNSKIYWG